VIFGFKGLKVTYVVIGRDTKSYKICFVFHVFSVSRQCKIGKAGCKVVCEEVQTTLVFRITDGLSGNVAVVCGTTAYVY
jgi:hypothetical protein